LLLQELNGKDPRKTAIDILDLFKEPFVVYDQAFYLTCSIGITRFPEIAHSFEEMIYQAESSMYIAKEKGKNRYHLFVKEDEEKLERKRAIELGLKEAIVNQELFVLYQPELCLDSKHVDSVETLVRWDHPELGSVSPAEFIPVAEESGKINDIGYWVLRQAIRQAKEWEKEGLTLDISVNVSPLQFQEPIFIDRVNAILEEEQFSHKRLILEITESVMQNINLSVKVTRKLHDLGIRIAIDDFGTGYSSLSVLNSLAIDYIKIDKAFIDKVPTDKKASSLVKAMLQMGENLDFMIIAEGIETEEQAEFLKQHHCKYGQGYLFSKPVSPEEISRIA
jgi:EAL domain-containing protein (putative c-di-GMP-specific phosphodiesterase class I)